MTGSERVHSGNRGPETTGPRTTGPRTRRPQGHGLGQTFQKPNLGQTFQKKKPDPSRMNGIKPATFLTGTKLSLVICSCLLGISSSTPTATGRKTFAKKERGCLNNPSRLYWARQETRGARGPSERRQMHNLAKHICCCCNIFLHMPISLYLCLQAACPRLINATYA